MTTEMLLGEVTHLRDEITDVRMGPIEDGIGTFTFKLRGAPYKARQTGRLRDLCLGYSEEADRRIAVMALLDGLANMMETA